MIDIHIRTIPHKQQRYDTVGDYYRVGDTDEFRISGCGDRRAEMAVAIHELVEKAAAEAAGVTNEATDEWDLAHPELAEPGDDPRAPYHAQHVVATMVERMFCAEVGLAGDEYKKILDAAREGEPVGKQSGLAPGLRRWAVATGYLNRVAQKRIEARKVWWRRALNWVLWGGLSVVTGGVAFVFVLLFWWFRHRGH